MGSTATSKSANLFQVYLRLRPPPAGSANSESFLTVESEEGRPPTHIILNPPNDRKRSTEKFAFTQVFEEDASQLDVFQCTGIAPLIEGVLAPHGGEGSDALLATLGVTGSGKVRDGASAGSMMMAMSVCPVANQDYADTYHPRIANAARHDADGPRRPFSLHRLPHARPEPPSRRRPFPTGLRRLRCLPHVCFELSRNRLLGLCRPLPGRLPSRHPYDCRNP